MRLVEDGEAETIPPLSPGRRPPAMAGGILRPLPARGSVRGLFCAKPAHVEREAGEGRVPHFTTMCMYLHACVQSDSNSV